MALINQSQVIDNVKSVSVSIHEQKIEHIDPSQYASDITEILVDYRPVEFSEKKLGIILSGASDYQFLHQDFVKVMPLLSVIVIDFHGFRDGRGYSLAQKIQQHPSYTPAIVLRASGDILPDTLQLLTEVGFSEFDIDDSDFNPSWFDYFVDIKHRYTGRSVTQLPIFAN